MAANTSELMTRLIDLFGPVASADPTKLYSNLMVSPAGNILIGSVTDNGVNKLQVTGSIQTTGGITWPDGNTQIVAQMGRNRVINGACAVAQRGSLVATTNVGGYGGPDRFFGGNLTTGGQLTQSLGTISYGGVTKNACVQTINTAITVFTTTNYVAGIGQRFEGYNVYDLLGQQATISFIFNTNVTGTFSVSFQDASAHSYVTTFTATANTPQKVVITVPTLPVGTLNTPNSSGIGAIIWIGAINNGTYTTAASSAWQTGNYISATGVTNWAATASNFIAVTELQLEAGPVATPFERESYGVTFLKCQRYYLVIGDFLANGNNTAGGNVYTDFTFPVTMRGTPTAAIAGTVTYVNSSAYTLSPAASKCRVNLVVTAAGYGYGYGAPLTFNAEL